MVSPKRVRVKSRRSETIWFIRRALLALRDRDIISDEGGYFYWSMGFSVTSTIIVNRKPLDQKP